MTPQEKEHLLNLAGKGHTEEAINGLLALELEEKKRSAALGLQSRYNQLKNQKILGTLSYESEVREENKITHALIELINLPLDSLPKRNLFEEKEEGESKNKPQRLWIVILGIAGSLASIIGLVLYFFPPGGGSAQLTVYVTDINGNVVLEHKGKLNTSIGNRSLRETIGEDGRTNFGDILPKYKGDSITIGFKAEGWVLADSYNTFEFDGKPIRLKIKKDDSLGIIKGVVKSRNGQEFIEGAKVLINADTAIYTNENGLFYVLLPPHMRIKSKTEQYTLTIQKEGYKTETQYHGVPSSNAEIRLEKE